MAYNKTNLYKRIIDVQTVVLQLKNEDEYITYKEIYWQHIYPKWRICYKTFHTYLGTPAKRELKKLENKNQIKLDL